MKNSVANNSVKDIISQLRTINQTIIIVSLTLLFASLLVTKNDNLSNAIKQVEDIQKANISENWDTNFVFNEFASDPGVWDTWEDNLYQDYYLKFPVKEFFRGGDIASDFHTVKISAPIFTFVGWDYTGYFRDQSEIDSEVPKTISELIELWNKSLNVQVFYTGKISDYSYIQREIGSPIEKIEITPISESRDQQSEFGSNLLGSFHPNIFNENEIDSIDQSVYGLSTNNELGNGDDIIWKFWIPAKAQPSIGNYTFNAAPYLCIKLDIDVKKCDSTFEQAFPELFIFSEGYRNLTLSELEKVLKNVKQEKMANVSILGVNLPSSQIQFFGSAILIFLQFYFLLLLRAFEIPLEQDNIPFWIGLVPDRLFQFATSLTVLIIPFVLIIYLITIYPISNEKGILLSIFILFSEVTIFITIYLNLSSMWKKIDITNKSVNNSTGLRNKYRKHIFLRRK